MAINDFDNKLSFLENSFLIKKVWNFITYRLGIHSPKVELTFFLSTLNLDEELLAATLIYENGIVANDNEELALYIHSSVIQLLMKVHELDKLEVISQSLPESMRNADNLRKMFLVMATDARLVILKIAEHLLKMRNGELDPSSNKKNLVKEAEIIYIPLANRLGLIQLKLELEDLAFKNNHFDQYKALEEQIEKIFPFRKTYIQKMMEKLKDLLQPVGNCNITGRAKHLFSIFQKMQRKKSSVQEIFDVVAIRIIVDTVKQCYQVLSIIHNTWTYLSEEFDDYIVLPKPNGYQSIHTAIYGPKNQIVEIQIRTEYMHRSAELGVAAHWIYKENSSKESYQLKLNWLKLLMAWQKNLNVELTSVFNDFIYVLTPKGDIMELPFLATPLDFAYYIHESIGHHCVGAKVNDVMVSLTHLLKNGDKIEIITGVNSYPKMDWINNNLGFVRTSRAKSKIIHWFKKQVKQENRLKGEQIYNKFLHELKREIDPKVWLDKFNLLDLNALLENLGTGQLKVSQLEEAIMNITCGEPLILTTKQLQKKLMIQVQGIKNMLVESAKCCCPLPGDAVIGYITQLRGVTIHQPNCKNLRYLASKYPDKVIEVSWGSNSRSQKHQSEITIESSEKFDKVLIDFLQKDCNIPIVNLVTTKINNGFKTNLVLLIPSRKEFDQLVVFLKKKFKGIVVYSP